MKAEKIVCGKCSLYTPRNIHNKCIYCGQPYIKKHHYSVEEKKAQVNYLEEVNNEHIRMKKDSKLKEMAIKKIRRKMNITSDPNGGAF